MRLLVLSNTPFLPPSAGNRERIGQMLDYFAARGWDVGMLLLPDVDLAEWDQAGMRARLACLELAAPPPSHDGSWLRRALRRLRDRESPAAGAPVGVDDWCPPWFRARAAELVREWAPDVVMVEYVFLSACLADLRRADGSAPVTVIDAHDVMHLRRAAYAEAGMAPQWFHTGYEEERRGLARADVVLAIQEEDARIFARMLPDGLVLTVSHGRRVEASLARPPGARLLFVASHNDLNVAGLGWFLRAVWPALRAAVPAVELVVCGTISEKIRVVPPGVTLRGFVPSLAAEYAAARVVINPVRAGTGLKVKVAEALSHGRPVVSAGAAGVEAEGVLVVDDAPGFGAAVRRLLEDGGLWSAMVEQAVRAGRRFSPDGAFGPLVDRLLDACRPAGQPAHPDA